MAILYFFVSPLLGVFFSAMSLIKNFTKDNALLLSLLSSAVLGVLNANKIPESDLYNYIENYRSIGGFGFLDYINHSLKEPAFFMYNYILHTVFAGNVKLYLIAHTTICYFLIGYAIIRCQEKLGFSPLVLFAGFIAAFGFPNLFSLSAHLMRQFLAASLIMVFIVEYGFWGNRKLGRLLLVLACFTHSTAFIFILALLPGMMKPVSLKRTITVLIFSGVIFTILFKYAFVLERIFSSLPFLSYVFSRINQTESIDLEPLGNLGIILFTLVILFAGFFAKNNQQIKGGNLTFYLAIVIFAFVLVNLNNTELALRFGFYLYFFFPVAWYLFLGYIDRKFNHRLGELICMVSTVFIVWFVYKLINGVWQYENIKAVLLIKNI
ncbi:EpsG family protein [Echinicola sp. 20G]|uniref:EpsG family protein n=1 Tax=Echinicola sp. 20G TaxID=2781961 RepID=UPI00190FC98E|nr:EpsG family protein [Echinicola sp. 20G]